MVKKNELKNLENSEIKNFILERVRLGASSPASRRGGKGGEVSTKIQFPKYLELFAPVVRGRKGEYYQMLYDMLGRGYIEAVIDGKRQSLRERIELTKTKRHDISVLVDSINISDFETDKKNAEERLSESLEKALEEANGLVEISFRDLAEENNNKEYKPERTIMSNKFACPKDGYSYPEIEPRLFSFNSPYGACPEGNGLGTRHLFGDEPCPVCMGARLRPEALHVYVGDSKTNIVDFVAMSIEKAFEFLDNAKLTDREKNISKVVVREIESRLRFMLNVGIEYLSLNRRAHTLSGGEAQRIRL